MIVEEVVPSCACEIIGKDKPAANTPIAIQITEFVRGNFISRIPSFSFRLSRFRPAAGSLKVTLSSGTVFYLTRRSLGGKTRSPTGGRAGREDLAYAMPEHRVGQTLTV